MAKKFFNIDLKKQGGPLLEMGGGFILGTMVTENNYFPTISEDPAKQQQIEMAGKALIGLAIAGGSKSKMMQNGGFGLALSGLYDAYQYYQMQNATKDQTETTGAIDWNQPEQMSTRKQFTGME